MSKEAKIVNEGKFLSNQWFF